MINVLILLSLGLTGMAIGTILGVLIGASMWR